MVRSINHDSTTHAINDPWAFHQYNKRGDFDDILFFSTLHLTAHTYVRDNNASTFTKWLPLSHNLKFTPKCDIFTTSQEL